MANIDEIPAREFADALRAAKPGARVDNSGCANFADSLVEGIDANAVRAVFEAAEGNGPDGRPPRLFAAHSDIMLPVNVFAPWLADLGSLEVAGLGDFRNLRFDVRLPPIGNEGEGEGRLPALLVSPGGLVGIEADCGGYLAGHPGNFSDAQDRFWVGRQENVWRREMRVLQAGARGYAMLDATRLVKQYMGLRLLMEAAAGEGGRLAPATILYLYWEPLNSARFAEFDEHRAEIERFAAAVAGAEVGFVAMSYFDLLVEWTRGKAPPWLAMHIARLHQRYSFRI